MKKGWAQEVLNFWFSHDYEAWWKPSDAFDAEIHERFGIEWARQARRPIAEFLGDPDTALAAVILFDQFPRNMFRDHADQFSTDHMALAIAKGAIERGYDDGMAADHRAFLYMPFQHSEDLKDQRQSLLLFTALGDGRMMPFARKHYEVIEKFGRFPHRNDVLGRKPTAMERAAGDVFPGDVMALVEAGRYQNSIEAGMARARLEAEGIISVLFDQEMSWVAGSIAIRLMVDDEDLDEARKILAD